MNVAVLVSGGVDSSVALHRLVAQGANVTAFYLKIWLEDELAHLGSCPWEEDLAYVQATCNQLGVPLKIIPLQTAYFERVVAHTIEQIKKGFTPNPDILCNQHVKFGAFYDYIDESFEFIATGHYAARVEGKRGAELHLTPDPIKDQTYFLSRLSQSQLNRCLFPIGAMKKSEVREYAQKQNLPAAARKDSQGICFLGTISFQEFVKHYCGTRQGELRELETGKIMGTHQGFWFYTIGQRGGIGLSGGPWYVAAKDIEKNIIFISRTYYSPDKTRDTFLVRDLLWHLPLPPEQYTDLAVKIRHGAQLYQTWLTPINQGHYHVMISERDQGIAAGQYAVFYQGTRCVGSGIIDNDTQTNTF